jgi:2-polyprenyl-3-methyl-5-hydroxy-6-metoxy-1,4-benzoquinol methylase
MKFQKQQQLCPVCGSAGFDVVLSPWAEEADPAQLYGAASGMPGTQQLVKCLACGMIYENPRYDAEVIIQGYTASQEAEHDSQYPMRVRSFYKTLQKHIRRIPLKGARVLDIGTAGGAFLDAAKQFGYNAYGMEPSADLVKRGRARGLQIEQGTIEKHNFPPDSFDMVCLWDVIEHLPDPKSALIEIRKLLKPNGIFLVNFPDIGTLQARLAGKRFWWLLSVHLHHFTRKSMTDILKRTGFEAFHFQRYWQILEFGYLEKMAVRYKIPLSKFITDLTPGFIQRISIPYYASQTTALARISK